MFCSLKGLSLALFLVWFFTGAVPLFAGITRASDDNERVFADPEVRRFPNSATGGMGEDIKRFGEEVAHRIDRIVKKKAFDLWNDPWMVQGIPLIFPSPVNGFNVGFRLQAQNIRRQDPHELELAFQVLGSDKGRYKHQFQFDRPWALGGKYRVTTKLFYDRDISVKYMGIGNNPPVDIVAVNAIDAPIYQNQRSGPTLSGQLLRYFGRHWRIGPIAGLKWTKITYPSNSLLDQQRPAGIAGGRTHYAGLAFIYDTLDFEPYPSRGGFNEFFITYSGKYIGSEYTFGRATYTYRRYTLLHRKLILAHRTLVEGLWGDVPFYELGAVGGSNSSLGLGGDRYIRGYQGNRFTDKFRFFMGYELRWDPMFFAFAKQDITIGIVPFLDFGRVWPTLIPFELGGVWHMSTGAGIRLIWNSRLVIRCDFSGNGDGFSTIININNSF